MLLSMSTNPTPTQPRTPPTVSEVRFSSQVGYQDCLIHLVLLTDTVRQDPPSPGVAKVVSEGITAMVLRPLAQPTLNQWHTDASVPEDQGDARRAASGDQRVTFRSLPSADSGFHSSDYDGDEDSDGSIGYQVSVGHEETARKLTSIKNNKANRSGHSTQTVDENLVGRPRWRQMDPDEKG